MIHTLKINLKLKDGRTFKIGASFTVSFDRDRPMMCNIHINDTTFKTRSTSLSSMSDDFYRPSMEELEEQSFDGVCDSLSGQCVEPDGWDEYGYPSWLLAMGMI